MDTFDLAALFKALIAHSKGNVLPTQGITLLVGPDNKEYLQGVGLRFEVPAGSVSGIASYLKAKKEQGAHSFSCDDDVVTFETLVERQLRGSDSIQFSNITRSSKKEILK